MSKRNLVINIDGQVHPCCYFANTLTLFDMKGSPDEWEDDFVYGGLKLDPNNFKLKMSWIFHEYVKRKSELSLKDNSLIDILNNEWFTKCLPESWDDDEKLHPFCKKFCQKGSPHFHGNE